MRETVARWLASLSRPTLSLYPLITKMRWKLDTSIKRVSPSPPHNGKMTAVRARGTGVSCITAEIVTNSVLRFLRLLDYNCWDCLYSLQGLKRFKISTDFKWKLLKQTSWFFMGPNDSYSTLNERRINIIGKVRCS